MGQSVKHGEQCLHRQSTTQVFAVAAYEPVSWVGSLGTVTSDRAFSITLHSKASLKHSQMTW